MRKEGKWSKKLKFYRASPMRDKVRNGKIKDIRFSLNKFSFGGGRMDKSFNDDELIDIMKEIEALEEDFSQEAATDAETAMTASDVMEDLSQLEEKAAIPLKPKAAPKAPAHATTKSAGTSMSFKVQGDLNLELQFDIGGKMVSLDVTESGLTITMDGGMTFTVPLHGKPHSKVA